MERVAERGSCTGGEEMVEGRKAAREWRENVEMAKGFGTRNTE